MSCGQVALDSQHPVEFNGLAAEGGEDESPAKESFQVCLTFNITSARVTESCSLGNENPDQTKVAWLWSIEIWSRSSGFPLQEEAESAGRRMQVVTQPTLPKSVLCVGDIKASKDVISIRDTDWKLWLQLWSEPTKTVRKSNK